MAFSDVKQALEKSRVKHKAVPDKQRQKWTRMEGDWAFLKFEKVGKTRMENSKCLYCSMVRVIELINEVAVKLDTEPFQEDQPEVHESEAPIDCRSWGVRG